MTAPAAVRVDGEDSPSASSLRVILAEVCAQTPPLSVGERQVIDQLQVFNQRLAAHRFQLAVVGQFKRGKSSLLNALLGAAILPTGVLPLTSIPTFIATGAEFGLRVEFTDKDPEEFVVPDSDALRTKVGEFVAEAANPANIKHVARVEVTLPSPLLSDGLILIDTPGVGSTVRHNTEAAEAALPECDAALFVVSPDPPITQVELDYLEKVRSSAIAILVALNKSDTTSPEDLNASISFLRSVLDGVGLSSAEIIPVSARQGLAALRDGDATALALTGIPTLEDRLRALIARDREGLLTAAIARKAGPLIGDLVSERSRPGGLDGAFWMFWANAWSPSTRPPSAWRSNGGQSRTA